MAGLQPTCVLAFRSRPAVYTACFLVKLILSLAVYTVSRLCKYSYPYPEFASVAKQYYESAEGYEDILFILSVVNVPLCELRKVTCWCCPPYLLYTSTRLGPRRLQ